MYGAQALGLSALLHDITPWMHTFFSSSSSSRKKLGLEDTVNPVGTLDKGVRATYTWKTTPEPMKFMLYCLLTATLHRWDIKLDKPFGIDQSRRQQVEAVSMSITTQSFRL